MVQEHETNVNELKLIIQENDENNENQLAELNNLNSHVKSQINQSIKPNKTPQNRT